MSRTRGRHRRGKTATATATAHHPTADETDPDRLPVAEAEKSSEEDNRDPGAGPEDGAIPETADESTPGTGEVPEPERPVTPTDEPVAATAHGTTAREQAEGESLEDRVAAEQPDFTDAEARDERSPDEQPGDEPGERPDVGPGVHVEEEPP